MHTPNLFWILVFNILFLIACLTGFTIYLRRFLKAYKRYKVKKIQRNYHFFINHWIIGIYLTCFISIIILFCVVISLFIVFQTNPHYLTNNLTIPLGYIFYGCAIGNYGLIILVASFVSMTAGNSYILLTEKNIIFFDNKIKLDYIKTFEVHRYLHHLIFYSKGFQIMEGTVNHKIIIGRAAKNFLKKHLVNLINETK